MNHFLLLFWLITFSYSSAFVLAPRVERLSKSSSWRLSLFGFLLFWPLGVLLLGRRFPEAVAWWKERYHSGQMKRWQVALVLAMLPVAVVGLLDGHGDLGSFGLSILVLVGVISNLWLWAQIVRYAGFA
jgi:hypothetical protein